MPPTPRTLRQWTQLARRRLVGILRKAQELPGLRRRGPEEPLWQVDVCLVSTQKITQLNSRYRKKRSPTDVLSFPPPATMKRKGYLGELVICLPVAKRQASERGHPTATELQVLLIHGVLHLLGLDHERSDRDAQEMKRWEKMILAGTGFEVVGGLIERAG